MSSVVLSLLLESVSPGSRGVTSQPPIPCFMKMNSSAVCFVQLPWSCMKSWAVLKESYGHEKCRCFLVCILFYVYLKASSYHKCLQSMYYADLRQNMCMGQHYLLDDSSLKMPEICIALQTEGVNQNDLLTNAAAWRSTSSSFVLFFLLFFFFLFLLKDVSRSLWPCPPVIEILTKTAIVLASVAARLGHNCMMWDTSHIVNRWSSLA